MSKLLSFPLGLLLLICPVAMASDDYQAAAWNPAHPNNYTVGRGGNSVQYVIIHVVQGSYNGCISWFKNPSARVSAHYVVSNGGDITQMVKNSDTGWHAGNWSYNQKSIGIEHEGYVTNPSFPDAMYRSSANLVRSICDRYGIPKSRSRIIGHNEVPGATHTDPGPHWDWGRFMSYVTSRPVTDSVESAAPGSEIIGLEEYRLKVTGVAFDVEKHQQTVTIAEGKTFLQTRTMANLLESDLSLDWSTLSQRISGDCAGDFPETWQGTEVISCAPGDCGGTFDLIYLYDRYDVEVWMRPMDGPWQKMGTGCAYAFKGWYLQLRK